MVVVALLSLMLIAVDHRFHKGHLFRSWIETAAYPLQQAVDLPRNFASWLAEGIASRESLQEESASLRSRNLLLKHQLQRQEAIEAENGRLRELLNASFVYGAIYQHDRVRLAEIVSIDLDTYSQEIILNKGTTDGVYVGQPLMDANGVMGQIVRATHNASTALLLSSPHHSIPVQNRRNGVRSIAVGTGHPTQLSLRYLPAESDLIVGDTLITSGLGGRFPYGYPVGTVISIDNHEGERFAEITLQAAARLERSREVLLLWPATSIEAPQ
jgi:rod shape-determining protein MreC